MPRHDSCCWWGQLLLRWGRLTPSRVVYTCLWSSYRLLLLVHLVVVCWCTWPLMLLLHPKHSLLCSATRMQRCWLLPHELKSRRWKCCRGRGRMISTCSCTTAVQHVGSTMLVCCGMAR